MANLAIEERLLHYFLAMGAQSADPLPNSPPGLSFVIGPERVHVAILKSDALVQRNRIVDVILDLSSLRSSVSHIYLAASKLIGTAIDADVFRSHGIGLLLFDDRRIEEAVPAQPTQVRQEVAAVQAPDPGLVAELATLKSMYFDMEQTIAKLREDLYSLHKSASATQMSSERVPAATMVQPHAIYAGPASELPSFFANNPWIEVLSKRGREENGPLAG